MKAANCRLQQNELPSNYSSVGYYFALNARL
jgi:hypothetical protein